uniref:Uncharacterized protein n=1 Tax=Mimivirus LCMiAC02 TaxID=2506609 RepID=A0A481Z0F1_9VIRU|nr:MAG: hypothetical protein LCMiAC02_00750 [Mimivirus LCMiAC02]
MQAIEFKKIYEMQFVNEQDRWRWNCISGKIRVTDPSYRPPEKKNSPIKLYGIVDNCAKGIWTIAVNVIKKGFSSGRIYDIYTYRYNKKKEGNQISNEESCENVNKVDFLVGVQNAQMGFFDDDYFPYLNDEIELKKFQKVCDDKIKRVKVGVVEYDKMKTRNNKKEYETELAKPVEYTKIKENGKNPMGLIAISGWGNGAYKCIAFRDKDNVIIGLYIQFVNKDYEDIARQVFNKRKLFDKHRERVFERYKRLMQKKYDKLKEKSDEEKEESDEEEEDKPKRRGRGKGKRNRNKKKESDEEEEKPKRRGRRKGKINRNKEKEREEEEEEDKQKRRGRRKKKSEKVKIKEESDEEYEEKPKRRGRGKSKRNKKRKSKNITDSDSD